MYFLYAPGGFGDEWFKEETVLDKFRWRGGSQCDTLGIILWSKPYSLTDSAGNEIVVLLMDTQGLFDNKSTINYCVTIFAMSTLLSSVQIFNLSNQIQEDDLQNLRLFTEFARLAQKEGTVTPFQKLLFLVRDWQNSDELEYGLEGGAEYLDNVLKVTKGQKPELQTVRKNLASCFERIECFLMPYPGQSIAKNNSEKVLGEIDDEFKEQITVFVPSLFDGAAISAKTVAGGEITCSDLFNLFRIYIEVFKSGKLPRPRSIFESTAQALNLVAEELAKVEYDSVMGGYLVSDPELIDKEVLLKFHTSSYQSALKMFENKPKLGTVELAEKHRQSLENWMKKRHEEFVKQVDERRRAKEEEGRLEEEKRVVEEENRRIEEEKRQVEQENSRIREEKENLEDDARRKEEEFEHRERIMKANPLYLFCYPQDIDTKQYMELKLFQRQQEIAQEQLCRNEQQMEQERAKSEAERRQMLEEQGRLRDKVKEMANRPPQVIRQRGGGGGIWGIVGQVVGAIIGKI